MRYAFTQSNHVVACGRQLHNGSVKCRVVQWDVKKSKPILAEEINCWSDELTMLTASEAKEAIEVERREAEASTYTSVASVEDDFFKDMGL